MAAGGAVVPAATVTVDEGRPVGVGALAQAAIRKANIIKIAETLPKIILWLSVSDIFISQKTEDPVRNPVGHTIGVFGQYLPVKV